MCRITILVKRNEDALTESFILELDATKLPSLNTPYFVQVERQGNLICFNFSYDDVTSRVSSFIYQPFQGKIGELTGRLFVLLIDDSAKTELVDSKWNHLEEYLARKFTIDSPIKKSNVELGVRISKKLYKFIMSHAVF